MSAQPDRGHLLLFVDDEPLVLEALKRCLFEEPFNVVTATSGREGLEILQKEPVSLVLSDLRMPGMSGTEFLAAAKKIKPDLVTMMLTGAADLEAAKRAINEVGVNRFLTKPWDERELSEAIKVSLRQLDLERENRRLLELTQAQNRQLQELNSTLEARVAERTLELAEANRELEESFKGSARMFTDLTETFDPELGAHSKRVADLSAAIARALQLAETEVQEIEIAGLLHDVGLIAIPRELLRMRTEAGSEISNLVRWHPSVASDILSGIARFARIAEIVRAHHERLDGSGYPEGRRDLTLPMKILSAAEYFDEIARPPGHTGRPDTDRALIRLQNRRFDPDVVRAIADWVGKANGGRRAREVGVEIKDLRPGMILARKLASINGHLILSDGATLSAATIQRLKSLKALGKLASHVYVLAREGEDR